MNKMFIVAVIVIFSACKKSGGKLEPEKEEVKSPTVPTVTCVNPIENANETYNAFLRAFLVRSGSQTYIW